MKIKRDVWVEGIELCTVCKNQITTTKWVVVRDGKDASYYHEVCMPEDVKEHLAKNSRDSTPFEILRPL